MKSAQTPRRFIWG